MSKETKGKVTELKPGITMDTRTPYETFWDKELEEGFKYHSPNGNQTKAIVDIREKAKELAELLVDLVPEGGEKMNAMTKLREVSMWANAGIAINEPCTGAYGEKETKY